MTQLKSEAAETRAAMEESTADVPPGTLGSWRRPGRGIVAAAAVGLTAVVVAIARVTGIGSAAMWLVAGVVAAITAAYLAAVVFKLGMVFCAAAMAAWPGTVHSGPRQLVPGQYFPDQYLPDQYLPDQYFQDQSHAENSEHPRQRLPDEALPLYTVLVPLVDSSGPADAAAIDRVVEAITALDYPAERLQVLLLADADRQSAAVPVNFEFVSVRSPSRAAACAVGLAMARGELCAVYDLGQRPDRGQLRAAVAAFRELPAWVVCVRPEVRCENPGTNWLSECAAADRAVGSALFLRGLDRFRLPLPVDGSSCHFRTEALRRLGPWGSQHRTDGADLGVLIARRGWSVRMISSVTDEAPDLGFGRWLRRRTAAIRGDHQTGVTHNRSPYRLWRDLGPVRFASMQLTMAGSAFAALVNPIFWVLTVSWLVVGSAQMTRVFPLAELVAVLAALLLGNLITAYSLMVGCMDQGLFAAVRTMLLGPAYWALISVAAYRAVFSARRPVPTRQAVPRVATS